MQYSLLLLPKARKVTYLVLHRELFCIHQRLWLLLRCEAQFRRNYRKIHSVENTHRLQKSLWRLIKVLQNFRKTLFDWGKNNSSIIWKTKTIYHWIHVKWTEPFWFFYKSQTLRFSHENRSIKQVWPPSWAICSSCLGSLHTWIMKMQEGYFFKSGQHCSGVILVPLYWHMSFSLPL